MLILKFNLIKLILYKLCYAYGSTITERVRGDLELLVLYGSVVACYYLISVLVSTVWQYNSVVSLKCRFLVVY